MVQVLLSVSAAGDYAGCVPLPTAGFATRRSNRAKHKEQLMVKWIAIVGLAATLAACSHAPAQSQAGAETTPWNGGIWNSVLGYHGPDNARVVSPR